MVQREGYDCYYQGTVVFLLLLRDGVERPRSMGLKLKEQSGNGVRNRNGELGRLMFLLLQLMILLLLIQLLILDRRKITWCGRKVGATAAALLPRRGHQEDLPEALVQAPPTLVASGGGSRGSSSSS